MSRKLIHGRASNATPGLIEEGGRLWLQLEEEDGVWDVRMSSYEEAEGWNGTSHLDSRLLSGCVCSDTSNLFVCKVTFLTSF